MGTTVTFHVNINIIRWNSKFVRVSVYYWKRTAMNIGETAYWDLRYKEELNRHIAFELFDWYCPFNIIFPMIETIFEINPVQKVLIIGVGRSNIIDCLYKKGFRDITAIDISSTVILEMQKKYSEYTGVEFFVMDCRQLLKFTDESFSIVFDKACIDSLFCSTDFMDSTTQAISEVFRVLKYDGTFVSISHATALSRVPYFRTVKWAIDAYKVAPDIGEGLTLYILTKTKNEVMLNRKVDGGEATLRAKSNRVVSKLDQNMNKSSTTKSGANTGSITVTASVDVLADLVAESEDLDS